MSSDSKLETKVMYMSEANIRKVLDQRSLTKEGFAKTAEQLLGEVVELRAALKETVEALRLSRDCLLMAKLRDYSGLTQKELEESQHNTSQEYANKISLVDLVISRADALLGKEPLPLAF